MSIVSAIEVSGDSHTAVIAEVEEDGSVRVLARAEDPGMELRVPSLLLDAAELAGRGADELGMIALGIAPQDPPTNRIAMTLLRAFASLTKAPFVAISALEALAFEASASAPIGAVLVPAIALPDGRISTASFALEDGGHLTRLSHAANVSLDEWLQQLAESKPAFALGFGTGYAVNREHLSDTLPELEGAPAYPSAFGVALAAATLVRRAPAQASEPAPEVASAAPPSAG